MKNITLTLKLTLGERKRLQQLVEAREEELRKLTGQRIDMSASAYIRWLMDEDAAKRGLDKPPARHAKDAQRETTERRTSPRRR